ncbi:MAG TPA: isoprenylcysteine carboxylmethyltransferase family protein [Anaerolineales bacterium]
MVKITTRIVLITSAYLLVCALGYLGYITLKQNLLGWFLILTAVLYGLSGPYLLRSNLKKEGIIRQERQDRSFWLIIPGFLVVFYASPIEYLHFPLILPRGIWAQIIGLGLILAGILLIAWAQSALKGRYSGRIWVVSGQTLVQAGPYHYVRHPAYAGFLLIGLGISTGYSSLVGLLAVPLLLLPGLLYRINVEEKILLSQFSEQYRQYSQCTKRLIPRIW